jgi:putative spermidine/putrescine transport system substrate-binding protein
MIAIFRKEIDVVQLPRRQFLKLSGAAGATLGLAACGGAPPPNPGAAGAGGAGEVVFGTWGGDYQKFQQDFVEPALARTDGAPTVVYDVGDHTSRLTKMRTQAGGPGTLDVAALADNQAQEAADAGLFARIDPARLPNYAHIREDFRSDLWVPHIYSAGVIIYNTEHVTTPPDSYEVFWDPAYAGRIGIMSIQWATEYFMAAALEAGGDPGNDWDAGWQRMLARKGTVRVYESQEQLGQAMMSGEVWLAYNWKARAYLWNKAGQAPLAAAIPREGTMPVVFTVGIPANAPNPDGAYAHINAMLDPEAQLQFGENMGYWPPSPTRTRPPSSPARSASRRRRSSGSTRWISPTSRRTTNAGASSTSNN